jgi:hypothetical protein
MFLSTQQKREAVKIAQESGLTCPHRASDRLESGVENPPDCERWANRGAELDERAWRVTEAYLSRPAKLLRSNRAAWRLERFGYGRDVDFCLAEDTAPAVPRLVGDAFVGGRS